MNVPCRTRKTLGVPASLSGILCNFRGFAVQSFQILVLVECCFTSDRARPTNPDHVFAQRSQVVMNNGLLSDSKWLFQEYFKETHNLSVVGAIR
jgi:hypothetical protein